MIETYSFGEWVSLRRKSLDLSQRELAAQTNCALATIKKIESDERRPSRDLAEALAAALDIPEAEQQKFVECARGLRAVDSLNALSNTPHTERPIVSPSADLPSSPIPLIGRDTELVEIIRLLDQPANRLLTLVGSGGAGKTRLAIEAARRLRDHFVDSTAFIPLATVTDASLIPMSIAQGLRLGLSGSAEAQVFAYLRDKTMLLVLDNCEQVVEGMAWLSNLLSNAPGIKVLATSRERLQLTEEWIYTVPMLAQAQAIDLFDQTAQRLNPHFQSTEEHAAVSMICHLVENLPLAIELAASWTPFLSCEQIAQNIQQDIDFLTVNVRNVPERHRSIRAVFDHSWRLLTPLEQDVMMRLSVFRGGWTVDEAQPIAGATLVILRALIEKSLVRVAGRGRYDLHELVRQYAADKLNTSGKETEVRQHHGQVYLALANKLDTEILGPNGIAAFARLDQEVDNFRAGISWALEVGDVDIARQYIDNLFMYWQRRGHWTEGERWSKAAGPRDGEQDTILLCWNLLQTAIFVAMQGRFSEASPYKTRAMEMAMRLEDPETMMRALYVEGQAVPYMETAEKIWNEFFAIATHLEVNSKGVMKELTFASAHFLYGDRLRDAGRNAEAASHYRQSLEFYRQVGNVDLIAYPIGNLGRLALQEGRVNEAYNALAESVAISRANGNRLGIADWQQQLGNASLIKGDLSQAESCFEESLALYQEIGAMRSCPDVLADLGYTAFLKGDRPQSRQYLYDSLRAYLKYTGMMQQMGIGWSIMLPPEFRLCFRTLALLDVMDGEFERAVLLLSAAAAHQSKFGVGADLGMQARVEEALATLKSQLPDETFTQIWDKGYSMPLEQVFAYLSEMLRTS